VISLFSLSSLSLTTPSLYPQSAWSHRPLLHLTTTTVDQCLLEHDLPHILLKPRNTPERARVEQGVGGKPPAAASPTTSPAHCPHCPTPGRRPHCLQTALQPRSDPARARSGRRERRSRSEAHTPPFPSRLTPPCMAPYVQRCVHLALHAQAPACPGHNRNLLHPD
jgi:hypothetical protein